MKLLKKPKNGTLTRSYLRMGWFVLCLTMVLSSCAKEPDEFITGDDEASLIVPEALTTDVVETKGDLYGLVVGKAFPANTTKVFSVVGYSGTAAPTDWSSPYIEDIAVNSGTNGALSFATPQNYPTNGNKVYFYAYSPMTAINSRPAYNASTPPKVTWLIDGQQDIMGAQVTTGIALNGANQQQPQFKFEHKLMQLKFKVKHTPETTDEAKITRVTIGADRFITMDLSTGKITTSMTEDISIYYDYEGQTVTTTAEKLGYDGCPVMLACKNNMYLKIEVNNETLRRKLELPADAGPGKVVEVTLIVGKNTIEVTSVTISPTIIPRAGANLSASLVTTGSPTMPITITAKTLDGATLASASSSSTDYKLVSLTIPANNTWTAREIQLYWSFNGSTDAPVGDQIIQSSYCVDRVTVDGVELPEEQITIPGNAYTAAVGLWGTLPETFILKVEGPNGEAWQSRTVDSYARGHEVELPRNRSLLGTRGWRLMLCAPNIPDKLIMTYKRSGATPVSPYEIWWNNEKAILHVDKLTTTTSDIAVHKQFCDSLGMRIATFAEIQETGTRETGWQHAELPGYWDTRYYWALQSADKSIRGYASRSDYGTISPTLPAQFTCILP